MTGAIPPASWPSTKRAICLEFPDSRDWEALILGILKQLSYGYYWDKSASNWEEARDTGLQIVLSFMDQIRCDGGAVPIDEPQCVDFPNNSPILDWQPMNPFLDPSKIPPGYIVQPWGVVPKFPPFPFTEGDVISGLFGLPVTTPALGQGLARVRVKINGKGTVEIHLVKVVLGGVAIITWDDNPLTAQVIDLEWHIIALPPETSDEDITEVTFDTEGDHHIDITMLPRFSAEAGFAGYGGGIRKIVLCGPDMQFVDRPGSDNGEFDQMAICESIRYQDGKLQGYCCGEWSDIPGQVGVPAPGGAQLPPAGPVTAGECKEFDVVVPGNGRLILPSPVNPGDSVQITLASGGWYDGNALHSWQCPSGQTYALGLCVSAGPTDAGSPIPALATGRLIAEIDGNFYDAYNTTIGVPTTASASDVYLQMNDATLSDNQGSITAHVKICALADCGINVVNASGATSVITKVGCHYTVTTYTDVADNVQQIFLENADTGVNFNIFNVSIPTVADFSVYYNGTGDPHTNVGIVGPLYKFAVAWTPSGHAPVTIEFDVS